MACGLCVISCRCYRLVVVVLGVKLHKAVVNSAQQLLFNEQKNMLKCIKVKHIQKKLIWSLCWLRTYRQVATTNVGFFKSKYPKLRSRGRKNKYLRYQKSHQISWKQQVSTVWLIAVTTRQRVHAAAYSWCVSRQEKKKKPCYDMW